MIEEKDYEHIIFDNMVRTRVLISSEHMTDGSMDEELSARALNKSRIKEMIYGEEVKELERLLTNLSMYIPSWYVDAEFILVEARKKCAELLR